MSPQKLLEGLKYLAEQAPIDAVLFQVPCAPSCTDHSMRIDVSPRDVLDLVDYVNALENSVRDLSSELRSSSADYRSIVEGDAAQ